MRPLMHPPYPIADLLSAALWLSPTTPHVFVTSEQTEDGIELKVWEGVPPTDRPSVMLEHGGTIRYVDFPEIAYDLTNLLTWVLHLQSDGSEIRYIVQDADEDPELSTGHFDCPSDWTDEYVAVFPNGLIAFPAPLTLTTPDHG